MWILSGYSNKKLACVTIFCRDINFFTTNFTNYWWGEWLLVNKKVILMADLDKTNKKLNILIVCKNIVK